MDFVKREDQHVIDEENYKIYMETLQKSQHMDIPEYQHTPISMEQLHQAMQTSLNAGTIMHNFQLPLSPRQMSTLMLKTNHLSRNFNNEIPAHLQRNIDVELVHNLADLPQNLRHDELLLTRNLDLNLARSLTNELELNNGLTQNLVQNLNDNLAIQDVLPPNLRSELPHEMNHEIDLSHHLNRNIEPQDLLNHDRRTPMQCVQDAQMLEQNIAQRLETNLQQTLGQRVDQRLVQNLHLHDNQRLEANDHMMPFHIKSEQEDDGYFYENMNQQQLTSVNGINGHMSTDHTQPNQPTIPQEQLFVYNNHVTIPTITAEHYRTSYPSYVRDNPQNLVMHRQFDNSSPYDEHSKEKESKTEKIENPKENLKPSDQNKIMYQEFPQDKIDVLKPEDVSLDIKGEYHCYSCNSVFPSKRLLKQHTRTCVDNEDESEKLGKFSCSQCSYRCQAPATLKIHERVHSGEKPFSCTFCNYKSGQKNNVAKHILVHMKEKPFSCQYCDYRCAQKNNLVVHERTHTGYKPFACPYCDYRTVQKPNLVKHMYLHTDQKPFSCDVCNYRCVQKTNLTKHKLRHLNERDGAKVDVKSQIKPYRPRQKSVKCPHCPYRCVQKASLEKHMVFKHNTDKEGLNLMKSNQCEEPIQNLSVKRDGPYDCTVHDAVAVEESHETQIQS